MKNVIRIVIAFMVLTLFLSGCTSEDNQEKEALNTVNGSSTDTIHGDLELQVFVGGYGDEFWKLAVKEFGKQYPNVNVILHAGPKVNEQMKARWFSDNPPDIAFCDGPNFPFSQLEEEGKFMDLKSWLDTEKTADGTALIKDNIYKWLLKKEEKIYYVPYVFGTLGLWYNEKIFEEHNLSVPTNFEEFTALAGKLKKYNISLMNYPGIYPVYLFEGFVWSGLATEGGEQIFKDMKDLKPGIFKSSEFVKTFKKLETLAKTDNAVMSGTTALNHIQAQMEWLNGKAAFIPNGLWLESEMKGSIGNDFKMRFVPSLIQDKNQKYAICPYSADLCIAQKSKNPDAAKAFLAFLYREDILEKFVEIVGVPTAYKMDISGLHVSDALVSVQKWIADPDVLIVPSNYIDQRMDKVFYDGLTSLMMGKITAEEYCDRLQREADRIEKEKK